MTMTIDDIKSHIESIKAAADTQHMDSLMKDFIEHVAQHSRGATIDGTPKVIVLVEAYRSL